MAMVFEYLGNIWYGIQSFVPFSPVCIFVGFVPYLRNICHPCDSLTGG